MSIELRCGKHDATVRGALFSRDESRVLTWSGDNTARLWDTDKKEPIQTFKHDHYVLGALFSRDESRVLTWSNDRTARLWDTDKKEPIQTFKHDDIVVGALFSRDESRVLTWSSDHTARLWALATAPDTSESFIADAMQSLIERTAAWLNSEGAYQPLEYKEWRKVIERRTPTGK